MSSSLDPIEDHLGAVVDNKVLDRSCTEVSESRFVGCCISEIDEEGDNVRRRSLDAGIDLVPRPYVFAAVA